MDTNRSSKCIFSSEDQTRGSWCWSKMSSQEPITLTAIIKISGGSLQLTAGEFPLPLLALSLYILHCVVACRIQFHDKHEIF